jgi:hypothetical protein
MWISTPFLSSCVPENFSHEKNDVENRVLRVVSLSSQQASGEKRPRPTFARSIKKSVWRKERKNHRVYWKGPVGAMRFSNQGETGSWISHLFQENTPRTLSLNIQVYAKCRVKWFYRRPLARCREWKKFRNREHVQTAYYQSGERFVFATRLPPFWEMECVEKTFLNRSNSTRPKKTKSGAGERNILSPHNRESRV